MVRPSAKPDSYIEVDRYASDQALHASRHQHRASYSQAVHHAETCRIVSDLAKETS